MDTYSAVRQSAGMIDLSSRGLIVVRGADRRAFLHALLTNDILALEPGTGCYAALLTPQGRMVADMCVLELGDVILLDCERPVKDTLLQTFDTLIFSEDVQLGDLSDAWGCVGVYGPAAARMTARALRDDGAGVTAGVSATLAALGPFQNVRVDCRGDVVVAARIDRFGVLGYLLYASMGQVPVIANAAIAAGVVVVDPETADILRVEAGEPAFLIDMTTDTIPSEAGIESRAISFTKGCFPGQEVIVRIRDRGHGRVAHRLVGLAVAGTVMPARGDRVLADGKDAGHVTSAVLSRARSGPLALGYVMRDLAQEGRLVTIARGEAHLEATVLLLPFTN